MRKKLLICWAAIVAVTALSAIAAQAAPRVFINGKLAESKHEPGFSIGRVRLHNAILKNLECEEFLAGTSWNEVKGGTERGFGEETAFFTWECKSETPCEVTNERGVKKEGIFVSAEGPPTFDGTEKKAVRSGNTSLPWPGELTEKEKGVRQALTHDVKVWTVIPLPKSLGGPGEGPGCEVLGGREIAFEDKEGATEKAEGDELAPRTVNGLKNGLSPSHGVFAGEKVGKEESEKGGKAPETGRLVNSEFGASYTTGELVAAGTADFELATAE